MIGTPYLVGIAAALAFGAGWQIQDWRHDAALHRAAEQVKQSQSLARMGVDRAATSYQSGQEDALRNATKNDPKVIYVAGKTEYRADCLDADGLSLVADEIRAANARRGVAGALPADPGADRQVEGQPAAVGREDDPAVR